MDCLIKRRTHNIVDILRDSKSQVYHYTMKGGCPYRGTCDRAIFQRTSIFPEVQVCMYDYTAVDVHHNLKYFTRLRNILQMDQTNTKLKTLATVTNSDVWRVVTDLRDPLFNTFSHGLHEVPERIALDRAHCFEFDMYVFLQNGKDFNNFLLIKVLSIFNVFIAVSLYTSPSPRDGLLSRMPSSA